MLHSRTCPTLQISRAGPASSCRVPAHSTVQPAVASCSSTASCIPRHPARQGCRHLGSRPQRQHRQCSTAAIDRDNASVLVCGGGGVALLAAKQLKDLGAWVWMLQRNHNRKAEIEGMGAIVVAGDALDPASLDKALESIEEVDAVISTVGGTSANPKVDGEGNINIINAAVKKGVKKFILVTSIGVGDSKDAPPKQVYQVLEPVLKEKVKAEDHLKAQSGLSWTIIRPGGLKSEPATGRGVLTQDTSVCGAIHRADVASLVAEALFSDKTDNKVLCGPCAASGRCSTPLFAPYRAEEPGLVQVLSAVDSQQLFGEPKLEPFHI